MKRLKNIATIDVILQKERKHNEFMSSCFKQFHHFPKNWLFSARIVHVLLLTEIKIAGATENKLLISLGVLNFLEANDLLKMALLLIANNVLFGQPYDKKVTNWLFNLVDDLDTFNSFAWGHYVFKMTMHYLRHGFRSRNTKKRLKSWRYWRQQMMRLKQITGSELTAICDMSEGPQFIPLVEMEMKEKNELLDEGDDGDDGAPTDKISLKRKARKKKKKTSVKKKQRKTVPITRLNKEEGFTPAYTPTPAEDFIPCFQAPLTDVRDLSLHMEKKVDATISTEQEVAPSAEKEVAGSRIMCGDVRVDYNYVVEEDRLIRVRLRSAYCISPFIDPTQASTAKHEQDKAKYEAFKRKLKPARQN
ncbi:hypothetical protein Dsin_011405 [Dipteronia sinensis]|uniref:DUF1985 domain-containing protein n=1 Tax=Dipteronia sinensis TaxID=43782 RepID=A0AAE0EFB5_9ROSI|nr:hypothetical protein Dsin_011405 [Dipteronia sinensis]